MEKKYNERSLNSKETDEILFEIKDNIENIQHTFVVLFAFIALISIWVFGIG